MTEQKQNKERLPEGVVEKNESGGFTIKLERIKRDVLHDQASISKEGIGCYNNPGGPTC